ncbi:MAG: DUF637 domain-containing protein [Cupriavidus sp.]|nr:DUF637 domain-containing protein [Cupriavidus sp.]
MTACKARLDKAGIGSLGDNIAQGNWTQAASQLGNYAQATVVRSAISAGINTAVYGGSFGQAFAGGLVRDAAALAANAVGVKLPGIGTEGATTETIIANAAAHALIGCAAQGLTGGDCAGGAIGGAASALSAPLIRDGIYADSPVLNYSDDRVRQALTVGLATLIGGAAGALLGTSATSAALAAQNESLNNATSGQKKPGTPDEIRKMLEQERRAFGQTGSVPNSGGSNGPAMVGPSPLALGGARSGSSIQQNKAVGDAYANQTYQNVLGEMPDAVQEVTVRTASGVRTRLDIIGTSPAGGVVCVECKASSTAPLTPNQAAAFPEMAETGATVVGKGKPGFPRGTVIPPTSVQIVRPGTTPNTGK